MRLSLIFLALFSFTLDAQSNWRPGFVVKDGVKITGEIDDRDWSYVIESFRFRPSSSGEVTVYRPSDKVAFGVGERRFVGKEINYITNSRKLKNLSRDTVLQWETSWGFLRQYYAGELSLYQFVGKRGKRHFYLQRDNQPLEYLEYELRLRRNSEKKVVQYLNNYKYQLVQVLDGCPSLSNQISDTAYKLKGLSRMMEAWYQCQEIKPEYIATVDKGTVQIGGLVTYVQTTAIALNFERGTITNEANLGLVPGVGLRYIFPGARKKYSLKAEALYQSFDKVARLQTRQDGGNVVVIRRDFSASVVQFNLLAELSLLTSKTSIYAEGGLASSYLLDSDQSQMQTITLPDGAQVSIDQDLNLESNMRNGIGWLAGIGLRRGPFQLGARFSRVARLKGNGRIGFNRAGVLVGYWF
ncbi:hypothetical protein [Neolewinella persica]|uniref:hypothetical protein n=1 Tax=Neolewinella persica TaxID=70998 RepID=UPI0003688ECC|nr:hypothetical protein [Neolewinella persica]